MRWMTLAEIAHDREIPVDAARRLVDEEHCPTLFRTHATLYLI